MTMLEAIDKVRYSAAVAVVAVALVGVVGLAAVTPACANQCVEQCRAQHNQCRIATKGSPSCDAQLTQCLRSCTGKH